MRPATLLMTLLMTTSLYCNSVSAAQNNSIASPGRCFDAHNPNDIRLWTQPAPGAAGDDPCLDIPHMHVYAAPINSNGPSAAILLIPGGGYDRLTNLKEQDPVAAYFSVQLNITTFILNYRLVQGNATYRYPVPMWDGQRALKYIRAHAGEFHIDPARIGVFGFSAGGHLATMLAEHSGNDFNLKGAPYTQDSIDTQSGKVDFLGLGYLVISMDPEQYGNSASRNHLLAGYRGKELEKLQHYLSGQEKISSHTPPVFLFVSTDDQRINPQNSIQFAEALKTANIPADVHVFPHGAHGVGLAQDMPEEKVWPELFHQWLISQGLLSN